MGFFSLRLILSILLFFFLHNFDPRNLFSTLINIFNFFSMISGIINFLYNSYISFFINTNKKIWMTISNNWNSAFISLSTNQKPSNVPFFLTPMLSGIFCHPICVIALSCPQLNTLFSIFFHIPSRRSEITIYFLSETWWERNDGFL